MPAKKKRKNPFRFVRMPYTIRDNVLITNGWMVTLPKDFHFKGGEKNNFTFSSPLEPGTLGNVKVEKGSVSLHYKNVHLMVDVQKPMSGEWEGFYIQLEPPRSPSR